MDILDPSAQHRIPVTAYGMTDVGLERKNNEDAFHVEEAAGLYVVCDGMGGHASGELASRLTVEHMTHFVTQTLLEPGFRWPYNTPEATVLETRILDSAVRLANRAVHAAATSDARHKGMGTTLVALLVGTHQIGVAHVGDSRVYRLRDGQLTQLTDDHSLLNHYIKTRNLTDEQIRSFKGKNVIVRAIGLRETVQPELQVIDVRPDDVLLLCSDGLTDLVADELIQAQMLVGVHDLKQGVEALIQAALDRGGRDNVTVVMLRTGAPVGGHGGGLGSESAAFGQNEGDTSPGFSTDEDGSWDQETLPNYQPLPSIIVRGAAPTPAAAQPAQAPPPSAPPAMSPAINRDTPLATPAVPKPRGPIPPPPSAPKPAATATPPAAPGRRTSAGFDSNGAPIPMPPTPARPSAAPADAEPQGGATQIPTPPDAAPPVPPPPPRRQRPPSGPAVSATLAALGAATAVNGASRSTRPPRSESPFAQTKVKPGGPVRRPGPTPAAGQRAVATARGQEEPIDPREVTGPMPAVTPNAPVVAAALPAVVVPNAAAPRPSTTPPPAADGPGTPPALPARAAEPPAVQVPAGDVGHHGSTVGAPMTPAVRVAATGMATAPYQVVVLPQGDAPIAAVTPPAPKAAADVFTAPTLPTATVVQMQASAATVPANRAVTPSTANPRRHDATDPMPIDEDGPDF